MSTISSELPENVHDGEDHAVSALKEENLKLSRLLAAAKSNTAILENMIEDREKTIDTLNQQLATARKTALAASRRPFPNLSDEPVWAEVIEVNHGTTGADSSQASGTELTIPVDANVPFALLPEDPTLVRRARPRHKKSKSGRQSGAEEGEDHSEGALSVSPSGRKDQPRRQRVLSADDSSRFGVVRIVGSDVAVQCDPVRIVENYEQMEQELSQLRAKVDQAAQKETVLYTTIDDLAKRLQTALADREEMFVKLHGYEQHWFGQ